MLETTSRKSAVDHDSAWLGRSGVPRSTNISARAPAIRTSENTPIAQASLRAVHVLIAAIVTLRPAGREEARCRWEYSRTSGGHDQGNDERREPVRRDRAAPPSLGRAAPAAQGARAFGQAVPAAPRLLRRRHRRLPGLPHGRAVLREVGPHAPAL